MKNETEKIYEYKGKNPVQLYDDKFNLPQDRLKPIIHDQDKYNCIVALVIFGIIMVILFYVHIHGYIDNLPVSRKHNVYSSIILLISIMLPYSFKMFKTLYKKRNAPPTCILDLQNQTIILPAALSCGGFGYDYYTIPDAIYEDVKWSRLCKVIIHFSAINNVKYSKFYKIVETPFVDIDFSWGKRNPLNSISRSVIVPMNRKQRKLLKKFFPEKKQERKLP